MSIHRNDCDDTHDERVRDNASYVHGDVRGGVCDGGHDGDEGVRGGDCAQPGQGWGNTGVTPAPAADPPDITNLSLLAREGSI